MKHISYEVVDKFEFSTTSSKPCPEGMPFWNMTKGRDEADVNGEHMFKLIQNSHLFKSQ
jgi:hypothetical protein